MSENKQDISNLKPEDIVYRQYENESDLEIMIKMIDAELSEPYSIYTYRYFVINWPQLTWLAYHNDQMVGVVIGKLEIHKNTKRNRGYVAMIVVNKQYRGLKIGKKLTQIFIDKIIELGGEEIVLETESVNSGALALYKSCGFAKVKRLLNYYQNGNDAFRLKLWISNKQEQEQEQEQGEEQKEEQEQNQQQNQNESKENQ
ncbi:Acyl-CoA N-acyltransferase [Pseudocohnilembus persalinus]|uniref:Acyl-CoA N-acyltransferase n=1 Tax=Pseudocohnilembus persalinus TaxID=266149 RepID=A0A0V0QM00_PSEPJ|nr:Acyl-CoA N-acyltransferase [Pseudocohnilembus persalinus]|eukprot:KRX03089.1 Acyl-CoA N-acyltransferase [Pseudocohnilembus persalinus]